MNAGFSPCGMVSIGQFAGRSMKQGKRPAIKNIGVGNLCPTDSW
jgi:hypothetical protein